MGCKKSKNLKAKNLEEERNLQIREQTTKHLDHLREHRKYVDHTKPLKFSCLQDYFLGRNYLDGKPCVIDGYTQEILTLDSMQAPILRHEATGVQVWQFALDLRARNQPEVIRQIFEERDRDKSGYLNRKELRDALQALGFQISQDELWTYTKYLGGYKNARISEKDFMSLVEYQYDDQICLFVYTDLLGFKSVASPGLKVSQIWTILARDDNAELGPGLHATRKAPDRWESQTEIVLNNRWQGESMARRWGGDAAARPSAPVNAELCAYILRTAGEGAAAFCIPVVCSRHAATCWRDERGRGLNMWGEDLLPWRDLWVIDLAFGGLLPDQDQMSSGVAGFLSGCPISDSIATALSARIYWRDWVYGKDDIDTVVFVEYLASIRMARGRLDLALLLLRRALMTRKLKLGYEDMSTLATASKLALFLEKCGEADEAYDLLHYVLIARRKELGDDHPDTLSTIAHWALILHKRGIRKEAKAWLLHVLHVCQKIVDEDREDAHQCIDNVAPLIMKAGQHKAHDRMVSQLKEKDLQRLLQKETGRLKKLTDPDTMMRTEAELPLREVVKRLKEEERKKMKSSSYEDLEDITADLRAAAKAKPTAVTDFQCLLEKEREKLKQLYQKRHDMMPQEFKDNQNRKDPIQQLEREARQQKQKAGSGRSSRQLQDSAKSQDSVKFKDPQRKKMEEELTLALKSVELSVMRKTPEVPLKRM